MLGQQMLVQLRLMLGQQMLVPHMFVDQHGDHLSKWERTRATARLQEQQPVALLIADADFPGEIRLQVVPDLVHAVRRCLDGCGISRHPVAYEFADRAGPVTSRTYADGRDNLRLGSSPPCGVGAWWRVGKPGYREQAQPVCGQEGHACVTACTFRLRTTLVKDAKLRLGGRARLDLRAFFGTEARTLLFEPVLLLAETLQFGDDCLIVAAVLAGKRFQLGLLLQQRRRSLARLVALTFGWVGTGNGPGLGELCCAKGPQLVDPGAQPPLSA